MKTRTDTERLDWMEKQRCDLFHYSQNVRSERYVVNNGSGTSGQTAREAIDNAMDAVEAEEIEAAWKWFRSARLNMWLDAGHHWYAARPESRNLQAEWKGETRDAAVLAAYRASTGRTGG